MHVQAVKLQADRPVRLAPWSAASLARPKWDPCAPPGFCRTRRRVPSLDRQRPPAGEPIGQPRRGREVVPGTLSLPDRRMKYTAGFENAFAAHPSCHGFLDRLSCRACATAGRGRSQHVRNASRLPIGRDRCLSDIAFLWVAFSTRTFGDVGSPRSAIREGVHLRRRSYEVRVEVRNASAAREDARPSHSHRTRSNHILRPVEAGLFFQEDCDESDIRRRNPANTAGLTQGCRADL